MAAPRRIAPRRPDAGAEALSILLTPQELKEYGESSPEAQTLVFALWKARVDSVIEREKRDYRIVRNGQVISLLSVVLTLAATVITAIVTKQPAESSLIVGGQGITAVAVSLSNRRNLTKIKQISESIPTAMDRIAPATASS